jgi:hypothetical protein
MSSDLDNTSLFTNSTSMWVGKEYSTEVSKQNWIDVPKDYVPFFDTLVQFNAYVMKPSKLAQRMIEHEVSVDDFRKFMTWILEHSPQVFTYYYPHDTHGKRWRMSKKPFAIKPYNYSAKGLASTIQGNRFFVNAQVFGDGAINTSNLTWNEFTNCVLGELPAMKMLKLEKEDKVVIQDLNNTNHTLSQHVKKVDKKLADLDETIQKMVTQVFDEIDEAYLGYNIGQLLKVDDMKAHLDEHMLGDTSKIHFAENKAKVTEANMHMRRHVADVFRQRQAKAEKIAEFYRTNPQLNPIPNTQEEEE